jgi:divalent metal cation (Fe/Co/Zn/Cd) transporter
MRGSLCLPPELNMTASQNSECGGHCSDSCEDPASAHAAVRPVFWLQSITIAWMLVECSVALYAASRARSVALFAFGSDSLVELLSATIVLLQFVPRFSLSKAAAERAASILLFLLAGSVICIATLNWNAPKETSYPGIAITAIALIVMPVLARLKRRQARALDNPALAADATQSATCAYLAGVTLAGLAAFAIWHIAWIDTVAALAAVPIVIVEGRRTWRGEGCGCA